MDRPLTIRVLLIEDNPGDARLVEIMLSQVENAYFEVSHAEQLHRGMELMKEAEFDVLLLDLSLPDSNGMETVNRMQAVASSLPLVVLSGREDEDTALEALQAGAEDYLVKGQGDGELIARSIRYAIERKRASEHLAYLTQFDQLTGLANRGLMQDRLERAVARADQLDGMVALIFVNLDRFQAVNDTFGEEGGDALLKAVAERLRDTMREGDTAARVGGDEFAAVVEGLSEAREAVPIAQDILRTLSRPFVLDGHEVFMTTSLGIAVRPPSEMDVLLKDAGAAMHRAREQGRNTYRFYTDEMNRRAEAYLVLQSDLRRALEREEFVLHYQPQVELETGHIVGAEALLRWDHAERGLVSPGEFIPMLEESGMIVEVGDWVLRKVCAQNKQWIDAGLPVVRVAVNISARQFEDEGLGESVIRALNDVGLDPSCLELELTESLVMNNPAHSSDVLNALRKQMQGLQVAIDDFGTGYSSLNYLTRFPLDVLKIDQSLVWEVPGDSAAAAIIPGIIGLAHSLRLKVIAEGIETEEQLAFLCDRGCDQVQGFHFSEPVPAEDFARLLKSEEPLPGFQ